LFLGVFRPDFAQMAIRAFIQTQPAIFTLVYPPKEFYQFKKLKNQ